MRNLPQSLVLIYFKRKDGMPLTRKEKREWKRYRKTYTVKDIFDEKVFEQLIRYQRQRPPAKEFFKKYDIPLTTPCPYHQKQQATGQGRRIPLRRLAVAASILFLVACATWWFFLHNEVKWIRLQTARGQQRQFTLPDSSRVWLNTGTVLRYPHHFEAGKREVFLEEGEAYFKVTKNAVQQPFVVHSKSQQVHVLGTKFNIKAYAQDSTITTTLIEGVVRVQQGTQSLVLRPAQQAITGKQEALRLSVDSFKEATAWKNKYFVFHNKRLSLIMAEVQRWYDVELIYVDPLNDVEFTIINFPRSESLQELLANLEASRLVRFNIIGRKIYIHKWSNIP